MDKRSRQGILTKRKKGKKGGKKKKKEEEIGAWMVNVAVNDARYRGLVSEKKAFNALKDIQEAEKKFGMFGTITEVIAIEHTDSKDRKSGIDIEIFFSSGSRIYIDVKNQGNEVLREKLARRNRCLMIIPWDASDQLVINIAMSTIKRWLYER